MREAYERAWATAAAPDGPWRNSFRTTPFDLASLGESAGAPPLAARFVVNEAHPQLKAKGGRLNRALHAAAAPQLEVGTREAYPPVARVGHAYPVRLPVGCALRDGRGVEWVIHAHPPNPANPERGNFLDGDYARACDELEKTWAAVLGAFHERLGGVP